MADPSTSGESDASPRERPADLTVALVAAVAENGVIGNEGGMPWHYPEDLQHFKETTMGNPVVLGRRTYEGIVAGLGEPLPGRTNIVLSSRDLDLQEGAVVANSVDAALDAARDELSTGHAGADDTIYVAGGATVYKQFLPLAERLVLTEVREEPEGDTYFPEVDWSEWTEINRDDRADLSFVTYERA